MNETPKRPRYDSAQEQHCSWCEESIPAGENQIVYGSGDSISYLRVYHPECEQRWVQLLDTDLDDMAAIRQILGVKS
jgi:hypothetical protein